MALEPECLQRPGELFLQIEEKKVEKFSALNLSQIRYKYNDLELLYSSKNFRLFYKPMNKNLLQISISKKNFNKAVERNKIKRRIREIFRKGSFANTIHGMIVFSVFKPFGGLSYSNAVIEIESAVKLFVSGKNKK